jgi:hypothetical protein
MEWQINFSQAQESLENKFSALQILMASTVGFGAGRV